MTTVLGTPVGSAFLSNAPSISDEFVTVLSGMLVEGEALVFVDEIRPAWRTLEEIPPVLGRLLGGRQQQ